MVELSDSQRAIIEEHHALVRKVARRFVYLFPSADYSEAESVAAFGLVRASAKYIEGQTIIPFPMFARAVMRCDLFDALRNGGFGGMRVLRYRGKVKTAFKTVPIEEWTESSTPIPLFAESVEAKHDALSLIERVPTKARLLLLRIANGMTLAEAARRDGVTEARASQRHTEAINAIRAAHAPTSTVICPQGHERPSHQRRCRECHNGAMREIRRVRREASH